MTIAENPEELSLLDAPDTEPLDQAESEGGRLAAEPSSDDMSESELPPPTLFKSFWLGGFESACQINTRGQRIDMIAATQHDTQVRDDYALMNRLGLRSARDGVRWTRIEAQPGHYDFASLAPMVDAAQEADIQVIWNLCHYGWPDFVDFWSPDFVTCFAAFARATAEFMHQRSDSIPFYTPINEISYLSWAIGTKGTIHPVTLGRGWDAKRQLVKASLAAMDAIREVDSRARFVHVDPIIHVVCPRDRPELAAAARAQDEVQYQAWDMLAGKLAPDLGGAPHYLDVVGVNYYHSNQFEHPDVRLRWEDYPRDDRFEPLYVLLQNVVQRYRRPLMMAETSHFGAGRALWMHSIAEEIWLARKKGVPIQGVCLYPLLDRPDWEDPCHWHNSGLVDLIPDEAGKLQRIVHEPYAQALSQAQTLLTQLGCR